MNKIQKGNNEFFISSDGKKAAFIQFEEHEKELTITHTIVEEELRGQAIGGKLVDRVAEYARENGKTINPVCSYASHIMNKNDDYQDVLSS